MSRPPAPVALKRTPRPPAWWPELGAVSARPGRHAREKAVLFAPAWHGMEYWIA